MTDHGVRRTYLAGCRCEPCRESNYRYCKHRRHAIARGASPTVDAAPVRAHIQALPHSDTAIAEIAGTARTTIHRIADGNVRRIKRTIAEAILAIRPDTPAGQRWVDATGARRRLQALAALGWSLAAIDQRLGYGRAAVNTVRVGHRRQITSSVDQRIRALYQALENTRPTPVDRIERRAVTRTVNDAARRGWPPPAAWDDIDTDPTPPAVRVRGDGLTAHEYDWLRACGETDETALTRLGVTRSAIDQARRRTT